MFDTNPLNCTANPRENPVERDACPRGLKEGKSGQGANPQYTFVHTTDIVDRKRIPEHLRDAS